MVAAKRNGFTLVELLVVVAIIVILLAILLPSMSKAIYRAQLTHCAANQRATATTFQLYSGDFNRFYPHRQSIATLAVWTYQYEWGATTGKDWVKVVKGYVQLNKHFLDPFDLPVDLEKAHQTSNDRVFGTHSWFAGAHYSEDGANHQKGMDRRGDRFEWRKDRFGVAYPGGPRKYPWIWADYVYTGTAVTQTAGLPNDPPQPLGIGNHPDRDGAWTPRKAQHEENFYVPQAPMMETYLTFTWWEGGPRGFVDQNFTRDDGSVALFEKIPFLYTDIDKDGRFDYIPNDWFDYNNAPQPVPKQ